MRGVLKVHQALLLMTMLLIKQYGTISLSLLRTSRVI